MPDGRSWYCKCFVVEVNDSVFALTSTRTTYKDPLGKEQTWEHAERAVRLWLLSRQHDPERLMDAELTNAIRLARKVLQLTG